MFLYRVLVMCAISRFVVPDGKVHGANMEPTLVLSIPDGPHVGPINLAIRSVFGGLKHADFIHGLLNDFTNNRLLRRHCSNTEQ